MLAQTLLLRHRFPDIAHQRYPIRLVAALPQDVAVYEGTERGDDSSADLLLGAGHPLRRRTGTRVSGLLAFSGAGHSRRQRGLFV